ncbi:DotA/TraY family protein [Pseudodesulfovibrio senegalensis]|uniref:DotA/TraY family protein n=1 Tax=Pseudodesulfovibrio senegalensis TaxID=1721087 RepID=A0A6N6N894_9BACT|nr:DotA/TraY family protein [Pseudodesulfovibrio senegalensis]KAB1443565.1 DotA/TraY family protein [Pseudodesulfovibrio senegalensis]
MKNPYPLPVDPSQGFTLPTLDPNDVSGRLLDAVFGPGWHSLQAGGGASSGSNAAVSMILPIFEQLNWLGTSMTIFLFVWIYTNGMIGTAHEGKPLGQRYHTLWVPVRVSFSLGMVAPVAKGFCLLQIAILWAVAFSIQCANWAWFVALDYQEKQVGQIVATLPPKVAEQANNLAKTIFVTQVHQEYWSQNYSNPDNPLYFPFKGNKIYERREETRDGRKYVLFVWTAPQNTNIRDTEMGYIRMPVVADSNIQVAHEQLIANLVSRCYDIAKNYVADEPFSVSPQKMLWLAADSYKKELRQYMADYYAAEVPEKRKEAFADFKEEALWRGWVSAGAYAWTMSGFLEGLNQDLKIFPSAFKPGYRGMGSGPDKGLSVMLSRAGKTANEAFDMSVASEAGKGGNEEGTLSTMFNEFFGGMVKKVIRGMNSGDPVVSMSEVGHTLISIVHVYITGVVAIKAGSSAVKQASDNGLIGKIGNFLSGGISGFLIEAGNKVVQFLGDFAIVGVIPIYLAGLAMAFLLPALPFVIWWGAVISWLILVIESLVAAPLWCVAHAMPDGEGFAGQHGRTGYMLLLSVLLKPILMLLGLLFALIIIAVIGPIIAESAEIIISSAPMLPGGTERHIGLPGTIFYIVFFCGFILFIVNRLYQLINHLPDNIMRWLGSMGAGAQLMNGAEDHMRGSTNQVFGVFSTTAHAVGGGGSPSESESKSGQDEDASLNEKSERDFKTNPLKGR